MIDFLLMLAIVGGFVTFLLFLLFVIREAARRDASDVRPSLRPMPLYHVTPQRVDRPTRKIVL